MNLWCNVALMCGLFLASLEGRDGSRLAISNQRLKELNDLIIKPLQKYYGTTGSEWVPNPVFSPFLEQMNVVESCTCQSMVLDRILRLYEEIFTEMSNNSEDEVATKNLTNAVIEVKNLRHKYIGEHKLWRILQDINLIKVKNSMVQKGALSEFFMVFGLAY